MDPKKSTLFTHLGMVTGSQLTVMDFNSASDLPQAKTKDIFDKFFMFFIRPSDKIILPYDEQFEVPRFEIKFDGFYKTTMRI